MLVVNFLPHWIHLGGGGIGCHTPPTSTNSHLTHLKHALWKGLSFAATNSVAYTLLPHREHCTRTKLTTMQSCDCHVILSSTLTLASPVKLVAVENPEVLFLADGGRSSRFIPFGLAVVYLSMVESSTSSVNNVITTLSW